MREAIAGAALLFVLLVGAAAPALVQLPGNGALASSTPSPPAASPSRVPLPSWQGKDSGNGFVVCGSSDTWTRPSRSEELAHLAADPRYRVVNLDQASPDAMAFYAAAVLYDGAGASSRSGLVILSGLWSDPNISRTGCTSAEPQVWLFGYAPAAYAADDPFVALLRVTPTPGYRMVVVTGAIRPTLVVADKTKLAVFQMPAAAITPRTATPVAKPTPAAVQPSYEPLQPNEAPRSLALPLGCRIERGVGHPDGMGATWTVQCGSALANLSVVAAAIHQGWTRLNGPPLGVGIQSYSKGQLTMQLAYRLDGPGFADPFQLVQYWRPFGAGAAATASPFAYLRAPTGFALPSGCAWRTESPLRFNAEGVQELTFECPAVDPARIAPLVRDGLVAQGWTLDTAGHEALVFRKGDLRVTFVDATDPTGPHPWMIEAFCIPGMDC